MNDYQAAFDSMAADISAITALLGFTKYPGIDLVLRSLTDLVLATAESQQLKDERDAAQARVAELERVLAPFAEVADAYDPAEDDSFQPWKDAPAVDVLRLTLGQHRAAKAALGATAPVAQAGQLHELDKQCRDDVARALGLTPQGDGYAWSALLADIKTAAKVAQAGQVPEGWKLVPIEPTEWPLEAGVKAYNAAVKYGCEQIDCIYDALHEMLAAAPAQEGE